MILTLVVAQSGYDYNKPGKPFSQGQQQGPSSNRPGSGYPSGPGPSSNRPGSGYPGPSGPSGPGGYSSTTPYPLRPQSDDFSGPGSTPGYGPGYTPGYGSASTPGYPSGPTDYPSETNSGYPGTSGTRGPSGPGYPGQRPSYPGQGPSGPSGPSGNYPGQGGPGRVPLSGGFPGQPGQNYPGQRFGPGFDDDTGAYEGGDYSAIPGTPDIDYPILTEIPRTGFRCDAQAYPGYYADTETRCQVFHVCANNNTYDFLCPNGTIFSQQDFVCVWWNQFDCSAAPELYRINAAIYDASNSVSNQGDLSSYGDYNQGPQGPSYPGSSGPGGPGYSGPAGPSAPGYPGPGGSGYPGSGPQGPSLNYPGSSGPQGPTSNYPGSGQQNYPGSSTPYPTSSRPYPGTTGYPSLQGQSGYPSGPSTPYPSSSQQSPSYGGNSGPSTNYPSTRPNAGYDTLGSNYPGGQGNQGQGYPSEKPNGPNFPSRGNGRPQQPNKEYLPPKN